MIEPRFFKRGAETLNTILNQLSHTRKGCLSDPPADVIKVHRFNAKTKKMCTTRGTSTNEANNRQLNHLLDQPSIGLTKAAQVIGNYYEDSNDRKRVLRLGEIESVSARTERLQALHGLAARCGFSDEDMGMQKPSYPPFSSENNQENIGFEYKLPTLFEESITKDAVDGEEDNDNDQLLTHTHGVSLLELDDFMPDMVDTQAEEDMCLDASDFPTPAKDPDMQEPSEEEANENTVFAMDADVDITACLPEIERAETTYETFSRLTQCAPWAPFRHPKYSY